LLQSKSRTSTGAIFELPWNCISLINATIKALSRISTIVGRYRGKHCRSCGPLFIACSEGCGLSSKSDWSIAGGLIRATVGLVGAIINYCLGLRIRHSGWLQLSHLQKMWKGWGCGGERVIQALRGQVWSIGA